MPSDPVPLLDEHATDIEADTVEVWTALSETLDAVMSRPWTAAFSRLAGSADGRASGPRPLADGSRIPGFRVIAAVPGSELVLRGRHRFSTYALVFRLEQVDVGRTRLRAESRAAFPGRSGGIYRLLVVGTGGHAVAVRRLLSSVRRRAEERGARC